MSAADHEDLRIVARPAEGVSLQQPVLRRAETRLCPAYAERKMHAGTALEWYQIADFVGDAGAGEVQPAVLGGTESAGRELPEPVAAGRYAVGEGTVEGVEQVGTLQVGGEVLGGLRPGAHIVQQFGRLPAAVEHHHDVVCEHQRAQHTHQFPHQRRRARMPQDARNRGA